MIGGGKKKGSGLFPVTAFFIAVHFKYIYCKQDLYVDSVKLSGDETVTFGNLPVGDVLLDY